MRVIAKTIQCFCYPVIMWLSSEMVDSYFIRAIVCSAQKDPKNGERKRQDSERTKPRLGYWSTQLIAVSYFGTGIVNVQYWLELYIKYYIK